MNSTKLLVSLIGSLVLASATAVAAEPKAAAELGDVQPVCQTTVLTTNGQAPVILAPADGAARSPRRSCAARSNSGWVWSRVC